MQFAFANIAAWILFGLGASISGFNFYLSFLRFPLHLWRGGTREDFRFDSGLPIIGSGFLFVAAILFHATKNTAALWLSLALAALDTGGLHWFFGTLAWYSILKPILTRRSR